ncbi:MCE family protein [Nocardioides sp. GY 10113]|uniref:MCE family protein n=1 Tax=Nocardioides sp. GY 10113 TaxID=2569761 RepID=UPI0010A8701B|nr:MCE family protein [Nocardioides sp. GY 10113]TIC87929.1 MCE family protein [Nocardioides sp. GY 10113]
MSEHLFPRSRVSPRALRLRLAAIGLAGGLLLGTLTLVLGLQTLGVLSGDVRVRVLLPTVGDTLGVNSDVKYQGLRVGRVVSVDPGVDGADGPSAEVLVQAESADLIPAAVRARVLPGTLFGGEYVDLVLPAGRGGVVTTAASRGSGGAAPLTDGDIVAADTSRATLRLMDTFETTQRLLASIDPGAWDEALSQLAAALDGRGRDLRRMIRDGDDFLARWAALEPRVFGSLDLAAEASDTVADVEPAFVSALEDSLPMARTIVGQEKRIQRLATGTTELLEGTEGVDGLTAFLAEHRAETARALDGLAATLRVFADRHPAFAALLSKAPRVLTNGAAAVQDGKIQMEGVLSLAFLDPYDAEDCPRYGDLAGKSCGGGR